MRYTIYCDESDDKGTFYSNFYGGALLREADRESVNNALNNIKMLHNLGGEAKWTKISEYNEEAYKAFVDEIFDLMAVDVLKLRVMFTQNINQTRHLEYEERKTFFKLYYQFVKHAFGLSYCNPGREADVTVGVLLDDAPDTVENLDSFRRYLSSLSDYPFFNKARVRISREDIAEINSAEHPILQAVDVVLGSMQFRLNNLHLAVPPGKRRRGKRTRAKERVYKHINARIRGIYPNFNIGITTGQPEGEACRWTHPYRHWCFIPHGSVVDRTRGKRQK